ncbi:MAG TPA: hypothetical protein VK599_14005, partial [Streptosporangiaceae bacterium]|nr:hypothetical protein [Streptosporangiaceae bacterium]
MSRRHATLPGAAPAGGPLPRGPLSSVPAPGGPASDGPAPDAAASGGLPPPGLERLTDAQLAELLHDPARRDAACETLVSRYQSIVNSCARRYRLPAQFTEDLVQVGYV